MSSSLIFDTLSRINERLCAIEHRLDTLRETLPQAPSPVTLSEDALALAQLTTLISAEVTAYWSAHRRPVTLRILSRNFSTRLTAYGGVRALLPTLTDGPNSPVVALLTLNGATLLFPRAAYATLTANELTVFTELASDAGALTRNSETKALLSRAGYDEKAAEDAAYAAFAAKGDTP